jgi:hypothetical protein
MHVESGNTVLKSSTSWRYRAAWSSSSRPERWLMTPPPSNVLLCKKDSPDQLGQFLVNFARPAWINLPPRLWQPDPGRGARAKCGEGDAVAGLAAQSRPRQKTRPGDTDKESSSDPGCRRPGTKDGCKCGCRRRTHRFQYARGCRGYLLRGTEKS